MDWIFDNIQIIVIVAAGIASILSQRRKSKTEQEAEEFLPPPVPVEEDEDLRRVREEIARKRAEREGQPYSGPTDSPSRPFSQDRTPDQNQDQAPGLDEYMEPEPAAAPVRPSRQPVSRTQDVEELEAQLAHQRDLQEKLVSLTQQRAQAMADNKAARVAIYATKAAAPAEMVMTHGRASSLPRLKSPGELRRAIIYREVLGPPKSAERDPRF